MFISSPQFQLNIVFIQALKHCTSYAVFIIRSQGNGRNGNIFYFHYLTVSLAKKIIFIFCRCTHRDGKEQNNTFKRSISIKATNSKIFLIQDQFATLPPSFTCARYFTGRIQKEKPPYELFLISKLPAFSTQSMADVHSLVLISNNLGCWSLPSAQC